MNDGAGISELFFERAARPIIEDVLAGVGYVAARLGSGSDVLGFDDGRSKDHDFGCRLTVLVDEEHRPLLGAIDEALAARLPSSVDGWPTRFVTTWDDGVGHKVEIKTVLDFATSRLGVDIGSPLDAAHWLCLTGQSVLEVIAGPVFHDSTTSYAGVRETLRWYPNDLWHYVLAAGWSRLEQELPFVGRTGELDDDAGSRIIASRLCRDLTHLAFLIERTWMPYPKWQGTALRRLSSGDVLAPLLLAIQAASDWNARQRLLEAAIDVVAEQHRNTGFDLPDSVTTSFFDRPFVVVSDKVSGALVDQIVDPEVRALPPIGSIEQWCDNVDLLAHPARRATAVPLYQVTSG